MRLWQKRARLYALATSTMERLARWPVRTVSLTGAACFFFIFVFDIQARQVGLSLVPLYVPALAVICWALGRRWGVPFAVIAAALTNLPDAAATDSLFTLSSAINAAVRASAYVALAFIIVACRHTFDQASLRAMYDGLTGVLNKMSFHATAERYLGAARRNRQSLVVVCVDLDNFKAVNTVHGHLTGDRVLHAFGKEALNAIRGSDLVGRLGGDEFGFVLSAASEKQAEGLVHLLHQRLSTALEKTGLPLSCSMGAVVVSPRSSLPSAELLNAADLLVRRAKKRGKNLVLLEQPAGPRALAS